MKKSLACLGLAALVGCAQIPPAYAVSQVLVDKTVCAPHEIGVAALETNFKMKRIAMGLLGSKKGMIEVFLSPDKHWAILVTDTNKLSCLTYGGSNWEGAEPSEDGASHG